MGVCGAAGEVEAVILPAGAVPQQAPVQLAGQDVVGVVVQLQLAEEPVEVAVAADVVREAGEGGHVTRQDGGRALQGDAAGGV